MEIITGKIVKFYFGVCLNEITANKMYFKILLVIDKIS